jgi:cytochrome c-type biogenesis protein CcmH/NrfG
MVTEQEFAKPQLEERREQALLLKTFRNSRDALQLARRTARETRVTMAVAAIAVGLLALAIYMLWRVLEQH